MEINAVAINKPENQIKDEVISQREVLITVKS